MNELCNIRCEGEIALITVNSPPVNALGVVVRRALVDAFAEVAQNEVIKGAVLICGGRTFFAGADISEFGKPPQHPTLATLLNTIECSVKPVIAAIHGTALGGGYELALVCHARIAVPSARVGLPEVKLGILPGAGGTQRLPRIVGPEIALDLITSGRSVGAPEALAFGMIDALSAEGRLQEDAISLVKDIVAKGEPIVRVRDRHDKVMQFKDNTELFDAFRRKNARAFRGFKAPGHIIEAVQTSVTLPFDEGLARERALFLELQQSNESQAQRHVFFAERETAKIADIPATTTTMAFNTVGVIGAGTMGGGIAMNFLDAGMPVVLVDTTQEALERGIAVIRRNYENAAKKGRLSNTQVEERLNLISPAVDLSALAQVDIVIEAVFEEMSVKKDVFSKLDAIAKPGAILATNTSFLDVDEIASTTKRPECVVGLHFFSPANVMRLLEVVRGARTSKEVIATALALAKRIGKTPVLSRVCHGFIANRLMRPRSVQAEELVLEGPTPSDIDQVMYDYGFAMGPFRMGDLVGLDVIGRGSGERTLRGDFVARGRLGQKSNAGFYDYDEKRNPNPSPIAAEVIANFAAHRGVKAGGAQPPEAILARLLYPVINEGAKILEEGVALRASDIDVAAILGYNWPVYTGGPMFWADTVGLDKVHEGLKALEAEYGPQFAPASLIVQLAEQGRGFGEL